MGQIRRMKLESARRRSARAMLSDVVREFTPNWFSVTMGTGALALALKQFPLPVPGIYDLAGGLWLLEVNGMVARRRRLCGPIAQKFSEIPPR